MKKNQVLLISQGAVIAAIYVALTMLSSAFGLSSGVIQVRISEALTILPYFTPAAIPGLFVGCIISNVLAGGVIWDVIFGSLATLIGAVCTYLLRRFKWLTPVPPIVSNMLIVPFVLRYAYGAPDSLPFMMATVGAGELIAAGLLGMLLLLALDKHRNTIFRNAK